MGLPLKLHTKQPSMLQAATMPLDWGPPRPLAILTTDQQPAHHGGRNQMANFQPDESSGTLHDTESVRVWDVS